MSKVVSKVVSSEYSSDSSEYADKPGIVGYDDNYSCMAEIQDEQLPHSAAHSRREKYKQQTENNNIAPQDLRIDGRFRIKNPKE